MAATRRMAQVGPQQLAADRTPIADIMTRSPVTVHPELDLEELARIFVEQGLSRVPVVDSEGFLVGIVSKTDLVVDHYLHGDTHVEQGTAARGYHVHEPGGTVADLMVAAIALPETITLGAAARRMLVENLHAVPVTSADRRVVGILSSTDVMAWVAGVSPSP